MKAIKNFNNFLKKYFSYATIFFKKINKSFKMWLMSFIIDAIIWICIENMQCNIVIFTKQCKMIL